ncbi:MAG TPA: DUF6586 family protein [Pseudomonadales bacterium]|nr:DUF6586 family protein [Pseudomonadales bacterium]
MSVRLSAQTNHQLYLAKLMLQDLQRKLREGLHPESVLLDAWGQAVVWHLQAAYRALVKELADKAKQDLPHVLLALDGNDLAAIDALPAELRELADLKRRSWLGQLLVADRDQPMQTALVVDPLALREVSQHYFGVDELTMWFSAFDGLIDRFRETTIEC